MADYGTVASFRAYHTARGRDTTSYSDGDIDAAKLIASEWIDNRHRSGFSGTKVGLRDQVREWPRLGAYDIYEYSISSATIPTEIENATYEATLKQLVSPGALSVDFTPSKYKRASVDGAVNVEYFGFVGANEVQTHFQIVDEILAPILTGYGAGSALSGAAYRS